MGETALASSESGASSPKHFVFFYTRRININTHLQIGKRQLNNALFFLLCEEQDANVTTKKLLGSKLGKTSQELFDAMSGPTKNHLKSDIFRAVFDSDNRRKRVGFQSCPRSPSSGGSFLSVPVGYSQHVLYS